MICLQNFEFTLIHVSGEDPRILSSDYLSRLPKNNMSELEKQSKNCEIPDKLFQIVHLPHQAKQNLVINNIALRTRSKGLLAEDETDSESDNESYEEVREDNPVLFEANSGMSELFDTEPESPEPDLALVFGNFNITKSQMVEAQSKCKFVSDIKTKLDKNIHSFRTKYVEIDSIMYRKNGNINRLILPSELATEFLSYIHCLYVHPGSKKLKSIASKFVYIRSINVECRNILRNCLRCISLKPQKPNLPSKIRQYPYEALPFSKTGIDLYDLGVNDRNNKRYLFVATCHLTGYVDGVPISKKNDEIVTKAFLELILRYGISGDVVLDNGGEFKGHIFNSVAKQFNLNLHRLSAYNSRSNGKAERSNREILIKQKLLGSNRKNWSSHWMFIQNIINNIPKDNLDGLTASECIFGRSLYFPMESENFKCATGEKLPFVKGLTKFTNELWPELQKFQFDRYEKFANKDNTECPIKKGSFVLYWKPVVKDGKLSRVWAGPVKVLKSFSKNSFHLIDPETGLKFKRSIRHLRRLGGKLQQNLENKFPDTEVESPNDPLVLFETDIENHQETQFRDS